MAQGPGRRGAVALLAAGVVAGVVGWLGFDWTLHATSTDTFCLSCHNHEIPLRQLQQTVHYSNRHGVVAHCADCHIQREFLPKMQRKIEASREVWGHITGIIDTEEKYLAHQPEMKERELARFRASDSATCRSCHLVERMDLAAQPAKARRAHEKLGQPGGKTCVDCHEDAGHAPLAVAAAEGEEESFDF